MTEQVTHRQTAQEVEAAFRAELQAVFAKYGAEMKASDHWMGYSECGEDIRITIDIGAIYNSDHECIREYTEIDLGTYFSGDSK